jgi:hypothetical protein
MRVFLPVAVVTGIVMLLAFLASCESDTPAELSFRATRSGHAKNCRMLVYNEKGRQIAEVDSDLGGVGYAKDLKPGKYSVKFADALGNFYAAERTVTLKPGDSYALDVDLDQAQEPATGGAAPAGDGGDSSE